MAAVACRPGSNELKSSFGQIAISRRLSPGFAGSFCRNSFHEKLVGRPASTLSTVSASWFSVCGMLSNMPI